MAAEQGAQQECKSTLGDISDDVADNEGICNFNIFLSIFSI